MPVPIKHIRSAVPDKIPTTEDLELGMIAINTYDGRLFIKRDDGAEEIIEILTELNGGGGAVDSVNGATGVVQIDAEDVPYNNTTSGLIADDVQSAIDEVAAAIPSVLIPAVDSYVAITNFTAGTTTTLTLAHTPISLDSIAVFFNGVYVHMADITSIVGTTLTFDNPIPLGTTIIDVRYFYTT